MGHYMIDTVKNKKRKEIEESAKSIKEKIEQLKLQLNLKKIEYEQIKTDEEINQLKLQLKSQEIK